MPGHTTQLAQLFCDIYRSAFSGEFVFAVKTSSGDVYEGVAPRHYVTPSREPGEEPVPGKVQVRLIRNGGNEAYIATPDGEAITVPAAAISL